MIAAAISFFAFMISSAFTGMAIKNGLPLDTVFTLGAVQFTIGAVQVMFIRRLV